MKCEKSPDGYHEWVVVEPAKLPDGREDLSVIPGVYCLHCHEVTELGELDDCYFEH